MSDETETPTRLFVEFGIEPVMRLRTLRRWQDEPFVASGSDGPEPYEYVLLSAVQADPAKFGVVPAVSLDDDGLETIAYMRGAHDARRKVKELLWVEVGAYNWAARTPLGSYGIQVVDGETLCAYNIWMCDEDHEDYPNNEPRGTLESAKAAAQTHFAKMIGDCYE